MHRQRATVKVNECEEVGWLTTRFAPPDPDDEEKLLALGLSMLGPRAAPQPGPINYDPTGLAHGFPARDSMSNRSVDFSVGQIAPIHVFRYPPECQGGASFKTYGIIAGTRRWKAAKKVNEVYVKQGKPAPLAEIDAVIYILDKQEYDSDRGQLHLQLVALAENCQREELSHTDRIQFTLACEQRYYKVYPQAAKAGRPKKSEARTPDAVLSPPRFDQAFSKLSGRSASSIRQDVNLAKNLQSRLSAVLFDRVQRREMSLSAGRALMPIPKNVQARIIQALEQRGLAVSEENIRAEIARDETLRRQRGRKARRPGTDPETGQEAPPGGNGNGNGNGHGTATPGAGELAEPPVACHDCDPCHSLAGNLMDCPVFAQLVVHLEVATDICCNIALRLRLSEQTIDSLRKPVGNLASAATALCHNLSSATTFRCFNPAALPEPAAAPAGRRP